MRAREVTLAVLIAGLMVFAWRVEPSFVTIRTQALLSTHSWEMAIVALPMLLIIVSGGIDLSVGSTFALSAVVLGLLYQRGMPVWWAAAAGFLVAGLAGALNGLLVSRLKVHPLLVTLATMAAFRGIAEGISMARPLSGYPDSLLWLSSKSILGLPFAGWLFGLLAVSTWLFLTRTVFGRWVVALGQSEKATAFSRIPVGRIKLWLFTLSGLACGIAAILSVARNNTAKADIGGGLELEAITVVVLGGAKIEGGSGSVLGLVLGLVLIHETKEFVSWHWKQSELNLIVIGCLLISAVIVQKVIEGRARSRTATKSGSVTP